MEVKKKGKNSKKLEEFEKYLANKTNKENTKPIQEFNKRPSSDHNI